MNKKKQQQKRRVDGQRNKKKKKKKTSFSPSETLSFLRQGPFPFLQGSKGIRRPQRRIYSQFHPRDIMYIKRKSGNHEKKT